MFRQTLLDDRNHIFHLTDRPVIDPEAMTRLVRSVVIATPGARHIEAAMAVSYPFVDGAKTDLQLSINVPVAQVQAAELAGSKVYSIEYESKF